MKGRKHLDEARDAALKLVQEIVTDGEAEGDVHHATVIVDIYGRASLIAWTNTPGSTAKLALRFAQACGEHWTGLHESLAPNPDEDEDALYRTAWREGVPLDVERARVTDRFRHHTAWRPVRAGASPLWSLDEGPPIIVFHGFKGGVGRTTLLASYALACARRGASGEKVSVIDVDLDAPGIGRLLAADADGTTAPWGTVDYLLESGAPHPIEDYFHVLAQEALTGSGRLEVTPAGQLTDSYVPKLARVDLEVHTALDQTPLAKLLQAVRARGPSRILLDGRAGLSPAAGLLLSGLAHLHVLVATSNPQSLAGLERIVRHLGFEAARRSLRQLECIVVQAHVPEVSPQPATDAFSARVEQIFRDGYYAAESNEDDSVWCLDDLDNKTAPHVPIPISYRAKLAHYASIDEVAEVLTTDPEYLALHARIDERLGGSLAEED